MAFGRTFGLGKEGRFRLSVRAEFQNIFNRLFYAVPTDGAPFARPFTTVSTPTGRTNPGGTLSAGYGFVDWVNGGINSIGGAQPRSGQIVARFQF
jgi:hypothetical protein